MRYKDDAERYAKYIAQKLRTDNTKKETTVYELLRHFLPGVEPDNDLLLELTRLFPKAAKIEGYTLDYSKHEETTVSLLFHIPFVLRKHKLRQHLSVKCPHCGKKNAVMYLHGMPTPDGFEMAERGDAIISGCAISGNEAKYLCKVCHHRFGRPAYFDRWDKENVRDREFNELVPNFYFSFGGYFGGFYIMEMHYSNDQYFVKASHTYEKPDLTLMTWKVFTSCTVEDCSVSYTITQRQFERFIRAVYAKAFIADWKHDYSNLHVRDGASMTLIIGKQEYGCLNEWPPYYHELFVMMRRKFRSAGFRLK